MKKVIAIMSLAGLLVTTAAFAHEGADGKVRTEANLKARAEKICTLSFPERCFDVHADQKDKFVLVGTVNSVGSTSLVVHAKAGAHIKGLNNTDVTIVVNSDTKIKDDNDATIKLTDIKAQDKVLIKGTIAGSAFTATEIKVKNDEEKDEVRAKANIAFGQVTAKTGTSLTLTNNVTGTSKTVTVNPDTKLNINGEVKTLADVNVGDRGLVKFKALLDTFVAKMIQLFR